MGTSENAPSRTFVNKGKRNEGWDQGELREQLRERQRELSRG
jgi:hypothetical protein